MSVKPPRGQGRRSGWCGSAPTGRSRPAALRRHACARAPARSARCGSARSRTRAGRTAAWRCTWPDARACLHSAAVRPAPTRASPSGHKYPRGGRAAGATGDRRPLRRRPAAPQPAALAGQTSPVRPPRSAAPPARPRPRRSRRSPPARASSAARVGAVGDDQHRRGGLGMAVLAHPVDRDARLAQHRRHLGQRARACPAARMPQVVGRRRRGGRAAGAGASVAAGWPKVGSRTPRAMSITSRHHRAGRRPCARAGAAQHDLARPRRPRAPPCWCRPPAGPAASCRRHQAGRHALLQPAAGHLRHAQQLDRGSPCRRPAGCPRW